MLLIPDPLRQYGEAPCARRGAPVTLPRSCLWVSYLLACLLAGCPEAPDGPRYEGAGHVQPQAGGTFVFHHESTVDSLDPHIGYNELATMATRLTHDGLLDYDHEANLIPSLAEALPEVSANGRIFRFRLRRGARFHPTPGHPEGRELTAHDVLWSMRRLLAPKTGSPAYGFYATIVGAEDYHAGRSDALPGVRLKDRYTIEFELTAPDQTFLNAMAMTFAYPVAREMYAHWGDDVGKHSAGTGPYRMVRWERGVQLEYERWEGYWNPRPRPDKLVYQEMLDRRVAALRFRNGEIGAIHRQNTADYLFFIGAEKWAPYREEAPLPSSWGFVMNTELAPFDNIHVRRAVAFAIDPQSWARARSGRLLPNGQLVPPTVPGHVANLPGEHHYDVARAKEEMAAAGYPDGLVDEVTVLIGEGDIGRIYGELVQEDLRRIGIQVKLRPLSFAAFLQESGTRRRAQAVLTGWNMDFPDPANFYDPLIHSRAISDERSQNKAFYSNPELDALLDRARATTHREARADLYAEAARVVVEDAPWAFIFVPIQLEVWQPYVKGYTPHPVWSQDYRQVWLDLPRQRIAANARSFQPFAALLGPLHRFLEGRAAP